MKKLSAFLVLLPLLAGNASANLLTNGDFEEVDGDLGAGKWAVYDGLPGWELTDGPGIEVQSNTVVHAFSGNNYVELDSDGNSGMFQEFTVADQGYYELSFWYRPRTDRVNDNTIEVQFESTSNSVLTVNETTLSMNDWTQYTIGLGFLTIGKHGVGFEATGVDNSLGGFLDDVAVKASPVPEPTSMALLGMGLLGFAAISRRKE